MRPGALPKGLAEERPRQGSGSAPQGYDRARPETQGFLHCRASPPGEEVVVTAFRLAQRVSRLQKQHLWLVD